MKQLSLDSARKPTGYGGWRPGAGRKRRRGAVSHQTRPKLARRFPQHVTLRLGGDTPSIARDWLMKRVIRPCISLCEKPFFRVVEFNVLANHVHLICEADDAMTLARGVQGLAIRFARRLNTALKRKGKFFGPRYHAVALRTPAQVRNTLRYVLLNRKHHAPATQRFFAGWVDPFSSGAWFRGWAAPIRVNVATGDLVALDAPTRPPQTWLLRTGWRRAGPISYNDRPS
ncbi:MAG TPA: transposase [Kofleriaceae bacterium]|jgi:REP element-mobilizing transposase RayT|nr:transposase [Kofleriaceae bacterium]